MEIEVYLHGQKMHMNVHVSFICNNQNRIQPECPSTRMDTMEYSTAIKKNELLRDATTWMILKIIMLSLGSKTKKIFCMISLILNFKNCKPIEMTESKSVIARR